MKPVLCTGDAFKDIVNPYTGEKMAVMMVLRSGAEPLFFAPETYDTCERMATSRAVYDKWSRVNGIAGLRRGKVPKCAYTGETLTFASGDGQSWLDGGFNPTRLHTRDEFLAKVNMRDGRSTRPAPTPSGTRAAPVKESAKVKSHEVGVTQTAVDLAEETMSKIKKAGRK